jgi:hypothetical protein
MDNTQSYISGICFQGIQHEGKENRYNKGGHELMTTVLVTFHCVTKHDINNLKGGEDLFWFRVSWLAGSIAMGLW